MNMSFLKNKLLITIFSLLFVCAITGFSNSILVYAEENVGTENMVLESKANLEETGEVYSITYILNGGENSENNPVEYHLGDEIALEEAVREGYRFTGWFNEENEQVQTLPTDNGGDIVLSAVWEYEYTLSFTANNLSTDYMTIDGEYETIKAIQGEEVVLPDVNFGGFVLSSEGQFYEQASIFTVTDNRTFELVEKNREQLYNENLECYEIWTYNHLNQIVRDYPQCNYILMSNITQPENTNWTPISTFEGVFYGENYWINDLTIQYGLTEPMLEITETDFGLFKENFGSIYNLGISGASFSFYNYNATYSDELYCGFVAARNTGVIDGCEVLGTFFQFSCIYPQTKAVVGLICGYNSSTVRNCEVFEAAAQLTTGFGGGIVGLNEGGTIAYCEIGLSSVSCYQGFENDGEDGYPSEHYAAIGGIVGFAKGGTITHCNVASNVDIDYNGYPSNSRTLAPELGIIAGRSYESTKYEDNEANGETGAINGLYVIEWETGWWIFAKKYTWDQSKYVGGEVGHYVTP